MKGIIIFCLVALFGAANLLRTEQATAPQMQSREVFPFELKDTLGRLVKAEDLKGKAFVMDFWFTGCKGCVNVADMLHKSIIPAFDGDTGLVFVSVSIDIDFLQWKRSLKGGLYTSNKQLNLFTMGMGSNHPLFKHYGFSGCPQMLIVDKDGQVLSTSVPSSPKLFIELLKKAKT